MSTTRYVYYLTLGLTFVIGASEAIFQSLELLVICGDGFKMLSQVINFASTSVKTPYIIGEVWISWYLIFLTISRKRKLRWKSSGVDRMVMCFWFIPSSSRNVITYLEFRLWTIHCSILTSPIEQSLMFQICWIVKEQFTKTIQNELTHKFTVIFGLKIGTVLGFYLQLLWHLRV